MYYAKKDLPFYTKTDITRIVASKQKKIDLALKRAKLGDFMYVFIVRYEMRFSKEKREAFNKSFYELLENSFKNINEKDEKGETVLHHAVEISDRKTVRLLIQKGAEVNARDKNGYTPLHCAVFAKSLENVKVLIRSGAEVNATQYIGGCAPLHSACRIGAGTPPTILQ